MAIDPLAPFPTDPAAKTAADLAEARRRVAALERRQFDPSNWGLAAGALAPQFVPQWHYLGAVGEPAYAAEFTSAIGAVSGQPWPLGFWKDPFGMVHMTGTAQRVSGTGDSDPVTTLPVGYRPDPANEAHPVGARNLLSVGPIVVLPTGEVSVPGLATAGWVQYFDGASFRT